MIYVVLTISMLSNNRVLCVVNSFTQPTLYSGVDSNLASGWLIVEYFKDLFINMRVCYIFAKLSL